MNRQEYLSRITKRIPVEKFLQLEEIPFEGWVIHPLSTNRNFIMYAQNFQEFIYLIGIINLDITNPPVNIDSILFQLAEGDDILEIPDEVAESSLKALYPTSILPLLLLGGALLLIPIIKR